MVLVENAVTFDILLLNSLSLVVKTVLSQKAHVATNGQLREATELIHTYFFMLLENPCCISIIRRVSSFVKLLPIIELMFKSCFHDLLSISSALSQLCLKRLREGPDNLWSELDAHLQRVLEVYPTGLPLGINVACLEIRLFEQACNDQTRNLCVSEHYSFL